MSVISKRGARALAVAAAGTLSFGLMVATGQAAHADAAPTGTDVVGVGSDTLQYMLDFGADGDTAGHLGNNVGKKDRLVSFDATPDANARAGYLNGSTSAALKGLTPTIVLRAGQSPVQRPNGSGSGIAALTNDPNHQIDFVRSSGTLNDNQVNAAKAASGVGNLHVIRLATDGLGVAAASTTNAPALSKAQLLKIYTCDDSARTWDQVGGKGTSTIIPILPQTGSGTRNTFLKDIGFVTQSDGSLQPKLGGCVKSAEENDPFALYVDASGNTAATASPDAIEPISEGRLDLYKTGYFLDPTKAYGTGAQPLKPTVQFIKSGTPSDGAAVYDNERPLFVIFRDSDIDSTAKYNGSALNWVQTFFLNDDGPAPYFESPAGQTLLASAGVTPAYADCGVNATSAAACNG